MGWRLERSSSSGSQGGREMWKMSERSRLGFSAAFLTLTASSEAIHSSIRRPCRIKQTSQCRCINQCAIQTETC